jgi:hypothetical protein
LRGKYRSDGEIAEIYAKHPNHARFIGISNGDNPKFESLKDEINFPLFSFQNPFWYL